MFRWKHTMVVVLCMALLFVSACSSKEKKDSEQASKTPQQSVSSTDTASSPTPEALIGKYDPPIKLTTISTSTTDVNFADGEDINNNVWTKAYLDELGIDIDFKYRAGTPDQAIQKINLMLASGEITDLMFVNNVQFQQLYQNGNLADLSDAYEKYASDDLKKIMTDDGGAALDSSKRDGKLYALPYFLDPIESTRMLWVRKDWLTKLKLPEPKTMDDMLAIAKAFKEQDPDGNGKPDTYGLAATKDIFGSIGGLEEFFYGNHAYPDIWVKDDSGKLVNGFTQPQMKTALTKLQELYKTGILAKEFGTKDGGKLQEDLTSAKLGMTYGIWWLPLYPLNSVIDKDPNADWKPYPIVSVDQDQALDAVPGLQVSGYYVVKKDYEHPEAVIKMANKFTEVKLASDKSVVDKYQLDPKTNNATWKYAAIYTEPTRKNLIVHQDVVKALKDPNMESKIMFESKINLDKIKDYQTNKTTANWSIVAAFGQDGAWSVAESYLNNKQYLYSAFTGIPTATMVAKSTTLVALMKEGLTKIIMGAASVDSYDDLVNSWLKAGGEQITKEVNDWYATNK